MGKSRSQTIRRARQEQAHKRSQEAAEARVALTRQGHTLAVQNAERMQALAEQTMPDGRRLGVRFTIEERMDVLLDSIAALLSVPRARLEIDWEEYVSAKLDVAEREAENYLAAMASAEARHELLKDLPFEQQQPSGLIVPGGVA